MIEAPYLSRVEAGQPGAFLAHLAGGEGSDDCAVFHNLKKDALLVSPYVNGPLQQYGLLLSPSPSLSLPVTISSCDVSKTKSTSFFRMFFFIFIFYINPQGPSES